jgi:hypothetical protein
LNLTGIVINLFWSTEDVITNTLKKYTADDSENFKTIVQLDCRGLEPVELSPSGPWTTEGAESGSRFESIKFEDDSEWIDYDERAKDVVGITEFAAQFIKLKN